ncbi:50S ribosomal protein L2 [Candidatus Legionella polyplacis]|uniref:50S ribosomal protein L2 n=1 Tax=Candidatus Legionella polyplacis TaxID=2005262 RepID=UPI000C1F70FD|nr:50S ribosomal protein L2 [Candidatus Legionella polyplacis]ATW02072.1 50S ribosomal protein L2 [Candidatus Legionella polyplacis]
MILVRSNPTSPGRRGHSRLLHKNIYKGKPYKSLVKKLNRTGGRNNQGRITVRHIGGGCRLKYRLIDFKRNKDYIKGRVCRIEYDPNRSALIALISYFDGEYRYIISPSNLEIGHIVISGDDVPVNNGNCLILQNIPIGTIIHCVELKPKKGAQLLRSAGSYGQVLSKEDKYAIVRLSSGEVRRVLLRCKATIGMVSNNEHNLRTLGKAGENRWRGIRPTVRGVAMNPIDHPHGGGEGRTSGGRHPVSPTGIPSKGYKTRNNKRTNFFIIKHRKVK